MKIQKISLQAFGQLQNSFSPEIATEIFGESLGKHFYRKYEESNRTFKIWEWDLKSLKKVSEYINRNEESKSYYLFGPHVCDLYYQETFEAVLKSITAVTDYKIYEHDNNDSPSLVLTEGNGYGNFAEITKEEYDQLSNLKPLRAMKYDDIVEEETGDWTQVCIAHSKEAEQDGNLDECDGECICGVEGCEEPAEYYLDLKS